MLTFFFSNHSSAPLTYVPLHLLIKACTYIFQKAAYFKLKPTDLVRRLVETLKMNKEQSTIFGQVWSKEASALTEKLSKHTLGGPLVLTGTDWQVALQVRKLFIRSFCPSLHAKKLHNRLHNNPNDLCMIQKLYFHSPWQMKLGVMRLSIVRWNFPLMNFHLFLDR